MNKKLLSTLTVLLSLVLVLATVPASGKRLIVQLSAPPLANHPGYAKLRSKNYAAMNDKDALELASIKDAVFLQHEKLISSLPKRWSVSSLRTESGLRPSMFHKLINGVAINVPDAEVRYAKRILSRIPGVVSVSEVRYYKPTLHTSVNTINTPSAWEALGSTEKDAGKGLKVAVVDTGIYTKNSMFSDEGMDYPTDGEYPRGEVENCNKKVIVSRLYADEGTIADYDNHTYPAANSSAHGTHCASTAAGSFAETDNDGLKLNLTGVAPGAWLMNYRIFYADPSGEDASASDEKIIQAFEDLVEDGADVVSNSWGSYAVISDGDPVSLAIRAMVDMGIPTIFSAGNEGPDTITVEKYYPALRVGATTSGAMLAYVMTTTPETADIRYIPIESPVDGTFAVYAPNESNIKGCDPFDVSFGEEENVAIIVRRGTCTFEQKINNTAKAGAKLAIIVNTDEEPMEMSCDYLALDAVSIGYKNNELIEMARSGAGLNVTLYAAMSIFPSDKDTLAEFSSRGPTPDMTLAPDVCAPGVNIYAAGYGSDEDPRVGFGQISGTSMACPHVSGASALILAKHPEFTVSEVYSALMSTANYKDVLDYDGTPGQPLNIGAGRIDLEKAIDPALYLNPPSLSFSLVPKDKDVSMKFEVKNYKGSEVALKIKAVHHTGKGAVEGAPSFVSVEPATVTIAGSGSVNVTVRINAVNGEIGDEQGYVVLEDSTTGNEVAHLPYWARIVYKESDRVDVYLIDVDLSNCDEESKDYRKRYTDVLNAEKVSYKVLDICDEEVDDAIDEINYLKARSAILFTGDYPIDWIMGSYSLVREVMHSKVPVIMMGATMSYSWGLEDGEVSAYRLPYEFGAAFQEEEETITTVKAGTDAPWTMSSFETATNVETRPLVIDEYNYCILKDGKDHPLAVATYSPPTIVENLGYSVNSFGIFSVVGLESIEDAAARSTLLMGLYRYATDSIDDDKMVIEDMGKGKCKLTPACKNGLHSIVVDWGNGKTTTEMLNGTASPSITYTYDKLDSYTVRAAVKTINGKFFELEPQTIDMKSGAIEVAVSKFALLVAVLVALFF